MYVDNNWYGHRSILAKYCGIKDKAIWGSIQHGVHIDYYTNDLGKHSLPFANYYCWDKKIAEHCKKNKIKNVIPIGAPFIYLDELLKIDKSSTESIGTLTFPGHSNPDDERYFNHNFFIKYIMDNYPGPYTACIFFFDFTEEVKSIYNKFGWNTVCAGSRLNVNFLKNVYCFINIHDYIVHPDLGSAFFYSLYLKKKTSYIKAIKVGNTHKYFSKYSKIHSKEQLKAFETKNNFIFDRIIDLKKGKRLGDLELGFEFKKSSYDLKKILGFDNLLKNISASLLTKIIDKKFKGMRKWGT